jgi:ribosomal protein S27AE
MTRKQKAVVIEEYIKLYSERSDNWLAEDLGVSENTVRDRRQDMESTSQVEKLDTLKDKPERRRIEATYCPHCGGWVEVRLRPVRLHCTRCGLEARP